MKATKNPLVILTTTAFMAALTSVMTIVIKIPSPQGYLNLGDCFVILSGWMLGPVYGFLAAAIGSAFADLFSGYAIYMPASFVIKGLMAVAVYYLPRFLSGKKSRHPAFCFLAGAAFAELIMILGYYLFEALIIGIGFSAAAVAIPLNCVQAFAGIAGAFYLARALEKTNLSNLFDIYKLKKDGNENGR